MTSVIKEALVWLDLSGVCMDKQKYYIRGWAGIISLAAVLFFEIMKTIFYINNIDVVAGIIEVSAPLHLALIKIYMLIKYRKEFGRLINQFYQLWPYKQLNEEFYQEIDSIYSTVKIMLRCYRWLAMITVSMIVPLKPYLSGKRGLPIDMWQPFDMTVPPWYYIVFVIQSLVSYFASFVNIAVDSLFVAFMTNLICQFKILGKNFKNLDMKGIKNVDDEEKCWEKMKEYIEYHNYLLSMVHELQRYFSLVFFNMFGVSTVTVCIDMYFVTYDGTMDFVRITKYIFQCSFFVFLLFSYCYTGNQLTHQCMKVADDIYESDWYCQPSSRIKNGVIRVIQKAQQLSTLTAGGIMELHLDNFIKMLRVAFSFFTLIRAQAAKKKGEAYSNFN